MAAGVFTTREKKQIKKIANKRITARAGKLHVAAASNVLAATVPVGDSGTITSQTGGISAVDAGTTKCDVTSRAALLTAQSARRRSIPQGTLQVRPRSAI